MEIKQKISTKSVQVREGKRDMNTREREKDREKRIKKELREREGWLWWEIWLFTFEKMMKRKKKKSE